MKTNRLTELQPRSNSYRAEDIIAQYDSLARFIEEAGPKAPLEIPNLGFSNKENQRMDQLLAEKHAPPNSL